jgi:SAM-dependent methyltransferase
MAGHARILRHQGLLPGMDQHYSANVKALEPVLHRQAQAVATAGRIADGTKPSLSVICWLWVLLLLWLTTSCVSTMTNYRGHKVFNPLYLFYLESPKRDQWQMPQQVLDALHLSEGSVVADIGAGGGYFTEKLCRRVGASGHIYATDVQDVMIRKLAKRVQKRGLANVSVIRGEFHDPKLPPGTCDWLFLSSVYKEIDERVAYMKTARQALKNKGRVAIIEYRTDAKEPGPPRKYRLPEQQVIAEMEAAGFGLVEQFDFLPREYFLVFERLDQPFRRPPPAARRTPGAGQARDGVKE